jgi:uncharacterized protein (DUF2252 family)
MKITVTIAREPGSRAKNRRNSVRKCSVRVSVKGTPDPGERMPRLVAERNRKMAASVHAYVGGGTTRFYEWLAASKRGALPEGPAIWICGDCHVVNLGPVASADGALAIEIRDFDQTVIGSPAHDLIRLGLSLAMAARGSRLPGVTTSRMLERMILGYATVLATKSWGKTSNSDMPKLVRLAMRQAGGRSWKHLPDERIDGTDPAISQQAALPDGH